MANENKEGFERRMTVVKDIIHGLSLEVRKASFWDKLRQLLAV